jgi:hypothetical protein
MINQFYLVNLFYLKKKVTIPFVLVQSLLFFEASLVLYNRRSKVAHFSVPYSP